MKKAKKKKKNTKTEQQNEIWTQDNALDGDTMAWKTNMIC